MVLNAIAAKLSRSRLNRGGNRQANAALCRVVIVRIRHHRPTLVRKRKKCILSEPTRAFCVSENDPAQEGARAGPRRFERREPRTSERGRAAPAIP